MDHDNKIIERIRNGDTESFTFLYDAYVRKIYDFIFFRTFHKETAEDLTSQVFIKALEKFSSFNSSKGSFSTWLYAIARNTVIDNSRTGKSFEDISEYENLTSGENISEIADNTLKIEKVGQLLQKLPEDIREIVVMRAWDGLSYKEISQILQKNEGSIKMAFFRASEKLKQNAHIALVILLAFNIQ